MQNISKKVNGPINQYVLDYLNFGRRIVRLKPLSKAPIDYDWVNTMGMSLEQCKEHDGNFGMCVDEDMLIVDVDVKNGKKGLESYEKLCDDMGNIYEPTVITASGGYHVYFSIPKGMSLKSKIDKYPDIDFLSRGRQVVIAGSKLLNNTKYDYGTEGFNVKEAPNYLIELLDKDSLLTEEVQPLQNRILDIKSLEELPEELLRKIQLKNITTPEVRGIVYQLKPDIEYEDWITVGMALHHWDLDKGLTIWKDWSKNGEKYKKGECEKKWITFKDNGIKGITLASVYYLVKKLRIADNWYEDWVFDVTAKDSPFYQMSTRTMMNSASFNKINYQNMPFNKEGKRMLPNKWVMLNGDLIPNVYGKVYRPDVDNETVRTDDGVLYINTFNKKSLPETAEVYSTEGKEAIQIIITHINMVCNHDKYVNDCLLQYIAHNVQYLGEKINWCPVLFSGEGTGKTFFAELMKTVIGVRNVGVIGTSTLASGFTGWNNQYAMVFIEELKISGYSTHGILNTLKPCISNSQIETVSKYSNPRTVKNTTNYFITTNHHGCIPVNKNSGRRFFMIDLLEPKCGKNYYKYLFESLVTHSGEIKKFFLEYPITQEFKNITKSEAPMTEYKKALMVTSNIHNEGYNEIENIIKGRKVFVDNDLKSLLPYSILPQKKTDILVNIGYRPYSTLINGEAIWIHTDLVGKVNDDDIKMYLEKEGNLKNKLFGELSIIEKEIEENEDEKIRQEYLENIKKSIDI